MPRELSRLQLIERSINKKFRIPSGIPLLPPSNAMSSSPPEIELPCVSPGQGPMLMAKLFQELLRHSDMPFEAVYLVMDRATSRRTARSWRTTLPY